MAGAARHRTTRSRLAHRIHRGPLGEAAPRAGPLPDVAGGGCQLRHLGGAAGPHLRRRDPRLRIVIRLDRLGGVARGPVCLGARDAEQHASARPVRDEHQPGDDGRPDHRSPRGHRGRGRRWRHFGPGRLPGKHARWRPQCHVRDTGVPGRCHCFPLSHHRHRPLHDFRWAQARFRFGRPVPPTARRGAEVVGEAGQEGLDPVPAGSGGGGGGGGPVDRAWGCGPRGSREPSSSACSCSSSISSRPSGR